MSERDLLLEQQVGENLDALITLDVRGYGVPRALYAEAREQAGKPLLLTAAQALAKVIVPDDAVVIATGFVFPPWGTGELDGVVGATVIARALEIGHGAKPVLVVEPELVPAVSALIRVAGLQPVTTKEAFAAPRTALVLGFTKDEAAAPAAATELLDTVKPKALLTIERPGRDANGRYHMGNGSDVTDYAAKIDHLFTQGTERGLLTVAIGDLGNELGLGSLQEVVKARIPFGTTIAASVPADHVITAAVSDWAGYALAAAISFVSGKANAAVSGDQLRQLLWRAVDTGLIDGSGYAIPAVDGVGVDYNARLAATLADIVSLPVQTKERFARMFDLAIELRRTAVAAD
jgi:hypothetical protein